MDDPSVAAAELLAAFKQMRRWPGMFLGGCGDDWQSASSFVTGLQVAQPLLFGPLREWGVTQVRGAANKYAGAHALGLLAAERHATHEPEDPRFPLTSLFCGLLCDYLEVMRDPGATERIARTYLAVRAEFDQAHELAHPDDGTTPWDPAWHQQCWEWERDYVPWKVVTSTYSPWGGTAVRSS